MSDDLTGRIVVEGVGRAEVVPDVATVHLAVRARAPRSSVALREAGELAQALLEHLSELGVADADVRTTHVDLHPQHEDGARIVGYLASNGVEATFRQIASIGEALDALSAGVGDALEVHGIHLAVGDTSAAVDAARAAAVAAARVEAQALADVAGVRLGDVVGMRLLSSPAPRAIGAAKALSMPVAPGTQTVEVRVTVAFVLL